MTRKNTTEMSCALDPLLVALELMGALATGVLSEHTELALDARRQSCHPQ